MRSLEILEKKRKKMTEYPNYVPLWERAIAEIMEKNLTQWPVTVFWSSQTVRKAGKGFCVFDLYCSRCNETIPFTLVSGMSWVTAGLLIGGAIEGHAHYST